MSQLNVWQRLAYFAGELLLIGGALWGLWARYITLVCPSGMIGLASPFSLIIIGLGLANLGLHPFGRASYLLGIFARWRALSVVLWFLGLLGAGYALNARMSFGSDYWWMGALVPAVIYQIFAVQPRSDPRLAPAATAPRPPLKPGKADGPARDATADTAVHPTGEEGRDG